MTARRHTINWILQHNLVDIQEQSIYIGRSKKCSAEALPVILAP